MKVYLAGPMTGYTDYNYPAFHEAAKKLREAGYDVLSPAEIKPADDAPWLDWMRASLQQMLTCTHVALLKGWHNSVGARLEQDLAAKLHMPCAPVEKFLTKEIK